MKKYFVILAFLIFPSLVFGHHSRAEFSEQELSMQGVLTNIIWRNPHVALFIDVETGDGKVQNWRIEGPSNPQALARGGVSSELFEIGQEMTVVGDVSTLRQALLVTNILLADGTEVIMNPSSPARWNGPTVGGNARNVEEPTIDTENLVFFRAWYPVGNPMMRLNRFSYTDEALAARSEWDLIENPIVRCEQPGMPVPLFHPQPILFTEEIENTIGLRHGYFDTQRTIHMDQNLNPEDQPASHLGFSQGKWENENTLLIETSRINYPYFDFNGTAQSEEIRITERYILNEDKTRLDFEVTIEDSLALAETASATWHFQALDREFTAYECNVF